MDPDRHFPTLPFITTASGRLWENRGRVHVDFDANFEKYFSTQQAHDAIDARYGPVMAVWLGMLHTLEDRRIFYAHVIEMWITGSADHRMRLSFGDVCIERFHLDDGVAVTRVSVDAFEDDPLMSLSPIDTIPLSVYPFEGDPLMPLTPIDLEGQDSFNLK